MAWKTTTDHDEIRMWARDRSGRPAVVKGTSSENTAGALRIDFSEDPNLQSITWDEFFDLFERNDFALRYTDTPEADVGPDASADDQFKLIDRNYTQSEDRTELPDAGDQDAAQENMYGSS